MIGLTFNGKHSYRDFGLRMYSPSRPFPEPKIVSEDMATMDGELDFTEANPQGRTLYKPVTHEIELRMIEMELAKVRSKAHKIAMWLLCGEKPLIYDDKSGVYYLARVINKLDLERELIQLRKITVQFKCRPFAQSFNQSNESLTRGEGLMRGYDYKRGMTPLIYNITAPTTLNIYNPGIYVKPLIRISGSFTTISFTYGDKTINCNQAVSSGTLDIEFSKMQALLNSTTKYNNYVNGEFFELANGDNALQISGTGLNCTVTLIFRYQYF
jgi:predicted phage tail component-like protein